MLLNAEHHQGKFNVLSSFWITTAFLLALTLLPAVPASALATLCGAFLLCVNFGRPVPAFGTVARPLALLLVVGGISCFGNEMRHVMRDVLYAVSPLALVYIGCCMGAHPRYRDKFVGAVLTTALVFAALHLSQFVLDPTLLAQGAQEIRDQAGPGDAIVTLAIFILCYAKRTPQVASFCRKIPFPVALTLLSLSLILSFSRTQFVSAVLFVFAMSGYMGRLSLKRILSLSAIIAAMVGVFTFSGLAASDGADGGFAGKIVNSMAEIAVSDYTDAEDINTNWRGFETFQALMSYANAGSVGQTIGQGFGALVDIGFYMKLGDSERRYIPTLHNGYAYVLVKFGIVGILIYFYLYFKLARSGAALASHPDWHVRFFGRLLLGLTASFAAIMFVVGGIPEAHAQTWLIVIGYVMTVAYWRRRQLAGAQKKLMKTE